MKCLASAHETSICEYKNMLNGTTESFVSKYFHKWNILTHSNLLLFHYKSGASTYHSMTKFSKD